MIKACSRLILGKILCKIKPAKFFSIITDEATDAANTEHLSISIRFVDEDGVPVNDFFVFVLVKLG